MEVDDGPILDSVIDLVSRYGIKRATMDELARHTGVSRQTLYDRYGGKDGVIAAAIRLGSSRIEKALQAEFAKETSLSNKIDAYYTIAIWPFYELMRSMPDAADLEKGLGAESKTVTKEATQRRQQILSELLSAHKLQANQSSQQIAVFFDQSCSRAKMLCADDTDLASYLSVLKDSMLALAGQQGR